MAGKPDGARADGKGRAQALASLVAELGNVSAACRALGVDRSAWYRLKPPGGPEPARPRVPKAAALAGEVRELALLHPEWGCDRIAHYLTLKGSPISSPTVQKILVRAGLGRVGQRMREAARRKDGAGGGSLGNA